MKSGILLFSLLLIVSFSSRVLFLDSIPDGMHRDEISVGYNAYSIAKTAKDEYGRFLPFLFEALEDFKLPVVVYTTVPTVLLFGLDDYWVRFPTAFFGALAPITLFFFTFTLTRNKSLSFLSAFLLAISPQHILFSRSVNESTISVFLIIVAVTFLLKLFNNWKFSYLTLTALFFTLSIFTYRTQFIFTPLIITSAIIIYSKYWKKWSERQLIFSFLTLLLFVATFSIVILNTSTTRIKDVNLFNDGDLKQTLAIQTREDGVAQPIITRIYHNKLWNYLIGFSQNYVSHFDPTYIFFTGDKLSSINSTPWMGHLFFIDLPFFIFGIIAILKIKKISKVALIPAWLIIGPIASAFTADSPSALRNLVSTPAYAIIIGLGILLIINAVKHQVLRLTFIVLLITLYLANFFYFVHLFATHKKIHEPWSRDVGLHAMVSETQKLEVNYQRVIFADYPALYAFLLYYKEIDPRMIQDVNFEDDFQKRPQKLVNIINPKYHVMSEPCLNQGKAGFLYVCREHRVSRSSKIVKSIRYVDMLPAFTFLEFPQNYDGIESGEILPARYEYLKENKIENITIIPELINN